MKEISPEKMTITESLIINTRRILGLKWEVGGRLGDRQKLNKELVHVDREKFMYTRQAENTDPNHGGVKRT